MISCTRTDHEHYCLYFNTPRTNLNGKCQVEPKSYTGQLYKQAFSSGLSEDAGEVLFHLYSNERESLLWKDCLTLPQ